VPAASWTKVATDPTMPLYYYQCSKLNPEIEMTVSAKKYGILLISFIHIYYRTFN
jgi:hypothetical protein